MKILWVYLLPMILCSQSVYLPATHSSYGYLDKMEAKMVIHGYRDATKPLTRKMIAKFLITIDTSQAALSDVEREELYFYKEEFFQELAMAGYENRGEERWHAFQYNSDSAVINVDLIGGFTYQNRADGKFVRVVSNGLAAQGTLGNNIGFYLNFRDNRETGTYLNPQRSFSPTPAEVVSRNLLPRAFEYDIVDAQVSMDVGFVTVSVEKMQNVWGEGERGNVIFSNKVPSYPQIKLRARLGKKIDFIYFHGWLFSDIVDSSRSYQVVDIPGKLGFRRVNKQKYIAAHMVEFTPWDGVDIAIGESEVYGSRNPELLYLIPMMFFKAGEHWMYDTDNSQMFGTLDLNIVKNYNFYGSLFIDEFSVDDFIRADRQRNQIAFTIGSRVYDLFLPDTKIVMEYTRLNPWVYNHKFPDVTFQSHSTDLGHWLGQNGDMFFTSFMFQPRRNFLIGMQFESVRKGGELPTINQYRRPTPSFLYSPLTKFESYGIVGKYEIVRDGVIDFHILRSRYTDELGMGKSDYNNKVDLYFGLRYNID